MRSGSSAVAVEGQRDVPLCLEAVAVLPSLVVEEAGEGGSQSGWTQPLLRLSSDSTAVEVRTSNDTSWNTQYGT